MGRVEVTVNVAMSYSPEEIFERVIENIIPALIKAVAAISHVEAYNYKITSESDLGKVIEVYDKISEVRIAKISVMMDRLKGKLRIDVYRGERGVEVKEAILERRSVRFFEQVPIDEETIKELLEAAINAPNANNAQQWYFVAVKSEEKRKRLREIIIDAYLEYLKEIRKDIDEKTMKRVRDAISSGLYDAPLYIAFYSDLRNLILKDREFEERMIVQSVSAAIENVLLRAWDLGFGSVWLGVAELREEEINKLLEVPEGLKLEAVVALGKPAKVGRKRPRKPLSEVSKIVRSPFPLPSPRLLLSLLLEL